MRLTLLALSLLAAPASFAATPPEAAAHKQEGDRLRQGGDLDGATRAYRAALQLDGGYADGHYGLAETQRALGNRDVAIAEYQLFIDLAQTTPAQAPWVEKARAAQVELSGGAQAARGAANESGGVAVAVGAARPPVAAAPVTIMHLAPAALPPTGPPPPGGAPVTASVAAAVASTAPAPPVPAPPSRALIEKLGAGDRAFLSADYRNALFTYQDAVYLDPTSAVARIRLARAYEALGHRDRAERQLKQALELDPGNADARRLIELQANSAPAAPPQSLGGALTLPPPSRAASPAPKTYRLTDDGEGPPPTTPPAVTPSDGDPR